MSATYTTKKILVKRSYQFLALILILLAGGLFLIPKHQKHDGIPPEQFVKNLLSTERYISTDLLADRMVNQDPVLLLIDTRTTEEFEKFSLPNAIHIPLAQMFDKNLNAYLNQDIYDIVLFANDNFLANEAWMIGNRLGYQRLYVLDGGLNAWFETIIEPPYPKETMSKEAFELYAFRKAAGKYFGVANDTVEIETKVIKKKAAKKVITKPKKKKKMPEGGC